MIRMAWFGIFEYMDIELKKLIPTVIIFAKKLEFIVNNALCVTYFFGLVKVSIYLNRLLLIHISLSATCQLDIAAL